MVQCEHDGAPVDMIVPTEVMDALDAASNDQSVHFLPVAAGVALAIITLLREYRINNENILHLVYRAAKSVVSSYRTWKSLIDCQLTIPQTMYDDSRKLANLLNRMQRFSEKESMTTPEIAKFVNEMKTDFDALFQANINTPGASRASPIISSQSITRPSRPQIIVRGQQSAMVLNSGNDWSTTTIMHPSGNAAAATRSFSSAADNTTESSTPRVLAEADDVLVSGSGNNETSTYFMTGGSAITIQQQVRGFRDCNKALEALTALSEDPDLPFYTRKRVARKLEAVLCGQTESSQPRHCRLVIKTSHVKHNKSNP